MRSIGIINLKGGVSKTCTAINVAAILAHDYKKRVLVVDCDSQCNLTEFLGGNSDTNTLAEILRRKSDAKACIQDSNVEGVAILPASAGLMDLDLTQATTKKVNLSCLYELAEEVFSLGLYDYILYDLPPAFNAAASAALLACDGVIIPVKLDAFSLRGLSNVLRQISTMRQINPRLHVAGCLVTMFYKSDKNAEAWATLKTSGLPVFERKIRYSHKVDEATFAGKPLVDFSPLCGPCRDYRAFVDELLGGVLHG